MQDEDDEVRYTEELSRSKRLASITKEARERALELSQHLEQEDLPDLRAIKALHAKLVKEEKALAKLLRPEGVAPRGGARGGRRECGGRGLKSRGKGRKGRGFV